MSHFTAAYHTFWSKCRARKRRKPFFYLWLKDLNSSSFTLAWTLSVNVRVFSTEEFQARSYPQQSISQQFVFKMGDLTFTLVVICLKTTQQLLNDSNLKSVASGTKSIETKSLVECCDRAMPAYRERLKVKEQSK